MRRHVTYRLAQLAGDAALLARGVAAQGMLAAEARADWCLLKRVVDLAGAGGEGAGGMSEAREGGRQRATVLAAVHDSLRVQIIG